MHRLFLLSPASTSGKRAMMLIRDQAEFELARRLREGQATLGEVFSFLSGLYFRGKYTYSQFFGRPGRGLRPEYVITSDAGLMPADAKMSIKRITEFSKVPIDLRESRYVDPLRATCELVAKKLPSQSEVVLLGSIATHKYTDVLLERFGARLKFPREFIGRGDMSRGGLLLRSVLANEELEYVSVADISSRKGARPAKLPRMAPGYLKSVSKSPKETP